MQSQESSLARDNYIHDMANLSTYLNYDFTKLQYLDGWVTDQRIVSSKLSCSRFLIPNTQNTTRVTPSVLNTWRKVDVIIVFYFYLFLRENVICSFLEESVCGRDPTHPTHLLPSPPPRKSNFKMYTGYRGPNLVGKRTCSKQRQQRNSRRRHRRIPRASSLCRVRGGDKKKTK